MHSRTDRIRIFGFLLLMVLLIIALRLLQLQILQGRKYASIAAGNMLHLLAERPSRGVIFDRHGHILVSNRNSYDLAVIPRLAGHRKTMRDLALLLGITEADLKASMAAERAAPLDPVVIKKGLSIAEISAVLERKERYPGAVLERNPYRCYAEGKLAAHLLGYVGEINREILEQRRSYGYRIGDIVGRDGLEKTWDLVLHGTWGGRQVEYASAGIQEKVLAGREPVRGNSLLLALDRDTQLAAETAIDGRPGAVVAVDVRTGEILAMASSPGYDPNAFVGGMSPDKWKSLLSSERHPLQNRASNSAWPPGSTFKMITLSAALQEGVVSRNEHFYCDGAYNIPGRRFRCWDLGGHGSVNLVQGMAQSCDIVFYELGRRLGEKRLAVYGRDFGLGEKSGLDLPGEAAGKMPSAAWRKARSEKSRAWYIGDTLNTSIGQGENQASPLQMALATAAVANGGKLLKPLLVKAILSADGEILKRFSPVCRRRLKVDESVLRIVRQGMRAAIEDPHGTGKLAAIKGVRVAGKTGTAEDPPRRTHAWFVGYAPYEKPRVAVCVFIEEGGHGGAASAPVARAVLQEALATTCDLP